MQLVVCSSSSPQQLNSSPLLQHSVLKHRRGAATLPVWAVGIFEVFQVHKPQLLFFLCSQAGLVKQQGTDIWAKWLFWLWITCRWPKNFYRDEACYYRLHWKLFWGCKKQYHAFWLGSVYCLDQLGLRILDSATLQMMPFLVITVCLHE